MKRPILGRYDDAVAQFLTLMRRLTFPFLGRVRLAARAHYALISGRFAEEQRAVAAGISLHLSRSSNGALRYKLRRSIHRIEKGLSMKDRRTVFGLGYIGQAVESFVRAKRSLGAHEITESEFAWYDATLSRYFAVCDSDDIKYISAKKEYFDSRDGAASTDSIGPFLAAERPSIPFGLHEFDLLVRRRRSVRWFLPTPVPQGTLDQAVRVANSSPSACNRQAVRILTFSDPEMAQRVAALAPGAAGLYQNFPAVSVLIGDLGAYAHERDRHAIYVDGGLKAMTFMYALEVMGISTCALNWPDNARLDRRAARELDLKPAERIVLMIAAGFADPQGLIPYSYKEQSTRP